MSFRPLLRKPLPLSRLSSRLSRPTRRFQSISSSQSTTSKRIDRILARLPKFLGPWTSGLRHAPGSNVVAFLILHEITAVVPLVGLAGLFHYTDWLPTYWTEGKYITDGTEKFGRYFARKGWFGFSRNESSQTEEFQDGNHEAEHMTEEAGKRWHVNPSSSRILVEIATAYAITKVFLPARVILSVWATPWFARVVIGRVGGGVGRLFGGGTKRSAAAGTAASTASVVGKDPRTRP